MIHCTEAERAGGELSGTRHTLPGPGNAAGVVISHAVGSLRQFSTLGWRTNCVSIFRMSVTSPVSVISEALPKERIRESHGGVVGSIFMVSHYGAVGAGSGCWFGKGELLEGVVSGS